MSSANLLLSRIGLQLYMYVKSCSVCERCSFLPEQLNRRYKLSPGIRLRYDLHGVIASWSQLMFNTSKGNDVNGTLIRMTEFLTD